jgi:hypothetical protein
MAETIHFPVRALIDVFGNEEEFVICGCDPRYEHPMGHEEIEDDSFTRLVDDYRLEDLPPF